jgi:hypothetical protein
MVLGTLANNGVRGLTATVCPGREGPKMTETLIAVTTLENADTDAAAAAIEGPEGREVDELEVTRDLVRQARDAGWCAPSAKRAAESKMDMNVRFLAQMDTRWKFHLRNGHEL